MNRQTTLAKNQEVPRNWVHVDASDQVVGRLAVKIATILMGKNKPTYTPHHDVGDFVVVTNAGKLTMTGSKLDHKVAQHFTGHPGGRKTRTYRELMEHKPERVLELAVKRMLPKNRLGRQMFKKLKVYAGPEHPHQAQQPAALDLASA